MVQSFLFVAVSFRNTSIERHRHQAQISLSGMLLHDVI